jgi:CheY-like chemotaxis protein
MPPEVADRAFEPFITTKDVGKGTGLGLSQVFGFVRQSGGCVKIESEVGRGTTIRILLPRFEGAAYRSPTAHRAPTREGAASEVVMVIEDEERVRAYSAEALRELGYTVVTAQSGAEALRLIEQGQRVDLLFTDVVMPGMTGPELAVQAQQLLPGLKVLYTTGYAGNIGIHGLEQGPNFLPKPFDIDQLGAKVRSAMDGLEGNSPLPPGRG